MLSLLKHNLDASILNTLFYYCIYTIYHSVSCSTNDGRPELHSSMLEFCHVTQL